MNEPQQKYPITCIECETYLGTYTNIDTIKDDGHIILEDTGHVSETTVMCKDCNASE